MKKKKFKLGMNVGSSSILVTFVLLCLVTFAALSFVSANSDNRLAKQTAERISAYYEADTQAEIMLANVDAQLRLLAKDTEKDIYIKDAINLFDKGGQYSIQNKDGDTFIHYELPITETQNLSITLKILYPEAADECAFEIVEWQDYTVYIPEEETIDDEKGGLLF